MGQRGWGDWGRYDSGLQLLYSPAFNSPYVGLSAVWDGVLQCKGLCLSFFFCQISSLFFSPCSFALRHRWGPVKLLVGWDWNSNQICKPICQRQYESKVNFDGRKKFTHTFLTHLRLQCPLMAAQAYTHQVLSMERESESVPPSLRARSKVNGIGGKYQISDDLNTGFTTSHSNLTCRWEDRASNICTIAPPDMTSYMHVYIRPNLFTSSVQSYEFMHVHMW